MWEITVKEIIGSKEDQSEVVIERYNQKVDNLDLKKVMNAVNVKPRKPRTKKEAA